MDDAAYSRLVEGEEIIIGAEEISNNINGGYISRKSERPKEPRKGEYAKSILYAGLDAIVTCFSLISSVDVLVLGFANLVANGISMGFGDFMSSSNEKDVAAKERAVTERDVANDSGPEELVELLRRYQALGMDVNDATTVR
ncbi:uncharacterized protein Pyn_03928 [Prunus yedoensis var. nudiflora]|uniref:Vacuolar iron transporter n=1 Tax=Prunus yedoensis var. nudiflora TaxID=2094558 RepID=A0A314UJ16_PRUYE|nr:uncharacterized protein Pyn_03928 [Prunus yedoensis var. nudiflora]